MNLRRMQAPCIKPLPINDSNKVNNSTITLIVVVEGQDIPNELVPHNASIDLSRSMAKGEDLQSVTIKPLWMQQSNHWLWWLKVKLLKVTNFVNINLHCNFSPHLLLIFYPFSRRPIWLTLMLKNPSTHLPSCEKKGGVFFSQIFHVIPPCFGHIFLFEFFDSIPPCFEIFNCI